MAVRLQSERSASVAQIEILDGWEGMDAAITNRADRLSRTMRENPSYRDIPFPDYGRRRMTDLSYSSGFLMFYLLDRLMGTEALLAGLRHHYQRHRATSGSFEDLAGALDETSPMRLDPFWEEWLESSRWVDRLEGSGSILEMLTGYRTLLRPRASN